MSNGSGYLCNIGHLAKGQCILSEHIWPHWHLPVVCRHKMINAAPAWEGGSSRCSATHGSALSTLLLLGASRVHGSAFPGSEECLRLCRGMQIRKPGHLASDVLQALLQVAIGQGP